MARSAIDGGSFRRLAVRVQYLIGAFGLFSVHPADGEANVHHHVIAYLSFRSEIQVGLPNNAAELHPADA